LGKSKKNLLGERFLNITIPKNATITTAKVDWKEDYGYYYDTEKSRIYTELSTNASTFSSSAKPSGRSTSTNYGTWYCSQGEWIDGVYYSTSTYCKPPEIKDAVQEVVNLSGWASGNALAIVTKPDPTGTDGYYFDAYTWDHAETGNEPKIHVEYIAHKIVARQSSSANSIATWATAATLDTSANTNKYGIIVPNGTSKVYAVWIDDATIKGKEFASGSWAASPTTIATGITGLSKNMSAVVDPTNSYIHLTYTDSTNKMVYKKYNTSAWDGSATTLDNTATCEYAAISVNSSTNDLYSFWIRDNDVYYKKAVYSAGPTWTWDTDPTTLESTGTNTYLSSANKDYLSGKIFLEYTTVGSPNYDVEWSYINLNTTPSAPTVLYLNESATSAQLGVANPVAVGDHLPVFSAIYNDPDTGDVSNKYQINIKSLLIATQAALPKFGTQDHPALL